jgi:D-alanine-D-alanine ligase
MIKELKNKKIGVLLGGYSEERAVSLKSGENVYNSLIKQNYNAVKIDPAHDNILAHNIDLAFITLHGKFGEDGAVQSLLEYCNIPYTGPGPSSSMICMNKVLTMLVLEKNQLPYPKFESVSTQKPECPNLPFPLVLKPIDEGSSIGVHIVENENDYNKLMPNLLKKYHTYIVQEFISGQEITIGILERNKTLQALPILELKCKNQFYDHQAKYTQGLTEFILPATLNTKDTTACQELAKKTFQIFRCKGISRIDMIFSKNTGPQILEINTLPGLTDLSDFPAQAKHAGISFDQLVEIIIKNAFQ